MSTRSAKATGATDREPATRATVHESGGNGKVAHLCGRGAGGAGKSSTRGGAAERAWRVAGAVGSP